MGIEENDNGQGSGSMVDWGLRFMGMGNRMQTKMHTNGFFKIWEIRKPLVLLVARGGIEPPTHGFSVRRLLIIPSTIL